MVKTRSLYLTWARIGTGSWRTDRRKNYNSLHDTRGQYLALRDGFYAQTARSANCKARTIVLSYALFAHKNRRSRLSTARGYYADKKHKLPCFPVDFYNSSTNENRNECSIEELQNVRLYRQLCLHTSC